MLRRSISDAVLLGEHAQHLAGLAALAPGDDHDGVVLADRPCARERHAHQSTSGASEMIFMNFFARSSRATGPKMRVPIGSRCVVDQHRRVVVEADVRAVGAPDLLRRPHDHRLHDVALLHLGVRDRLLHRHDDDVAERRVLAACVPPSTLMHSTLRAPELSATSSTVSAWIMRHSPPTSGSPAPSLTTEDRSTAQRLSRDERPRLDDRDPVADLHWFFSSCAL